MQGCRLKELLTTSNIAKLIVTLIKTFYRFAGESDILMVEYFSTENTNTFVVVIARGKRDIRP